MRIFIEEIEKIDLKSPLLIEGLGGSGLIGRLAVEHLVGELDAVKIAEIYSGYFLPQVLVDGYVVHPIRNRVYACKGKEREKDDLLFLTGDFRTTMNEGYYALTDFYLDTAEKYGVRRIYTLGGYEVGHPVGEPSVICAVNDERLLEEMKRYDLKFIGGKYDIFGVGALLLGMGRLRGFDGICLLGTTSGYFVDPKGAQQVLNVLCRILDIEVNMDALKKRAEEMEKIIVIEKMKKSKAEKNTFSKKEEYLGYYV
jgi:hypothetical protein